MRIVFACALVVLAAACGSSEPRAKATTRTTASPATTTAGSAAARRRCRAKQGRALARIERDLRAIRRAARLPTEDKLKGNAAVSNAIDRFLVDVAMAPIDLKVKNRLIDHAAAAVVAVCEQCFQALEASRPIPAIAHEGAGADCPAP